MTSFKYLVYGAVAIVIYSAYLFGTRSVGGGNKYLDWIVLVLSVLSVLLWPAVRAANRNYLLLFMGALLLLLFFWTFWFLAVVFGEGP